jgi:hypothetical protein
MNGEGPGFGNRALIVASVLFILIVGAIFFAVTRSGSSSQSDTATSGPQVTDLRVGRSVRMTVAGSLVGDESYESYTIEINQTQRIITRSKGYDGAIVEQRTYVNSRKAYEQFVYALDRQDYTETKSVSGKAAEERGACQSGKRYAFEILDNGSSISRLWTTTCGGSLSTIGADRGTLQDMFNDQIPDTGQVLRGSRL